MKLNELTIEIAKRESGKKQVNIAQIKEIVKVLADIMYSLDGKAILLVYNLIKNGKKRAIK